MRETSFRDFFCRFRGENQELFRCFRCENQELFHFFSCRFGVDVSPTRHSRLFQKREKFHFSNTFAPDFYIFPTRLSPNFTFFQHVCANNPPIIRGYSAVVGSYLV